MSIKELSIFLGNFGIVSSWQQGSINFCKIVNLEKSVEISLLNKFYICVCCFNEKHINTKFYKNYNDMIGAIIFYIK